MLIILICSYALVFNGVFLKTGCCAESSWTKALRYQGYRLNAADGFLSPARDKTDCIRRCILADNYTCVATKFVSTSTCHHFDLNSKLRLRTSSDALEESTLIHTKEKTACLFRVEVESIFAAAKQCQFLGGHLMSLDEMTDFMERGLGRHQCGWISDGTQRKFEVDSISYCPKASQRDVWCTF